MSENEIPNIINIKNNNLIQNVKISRFKMVLKDILLLSIKLINTIPYINVKKGLKSLSKYLSKVIEEVIAKV